MNLLAEASMAGSGGGWILDVIFFALILIGLIIGCTRGFVRGVCKLGGTLLAVVLAFSMCTPLQAALESSFGLTTAIANGVGNETLAGWLSIVICFIGLLVVTKLAAWLIGKLARVLVEKSKVLNVTDRILGGILGLGEALLLILVLLTVCHWINADFINEFIQSSVVVKSIYTSEWFIEATNLPGRIINRM